MSTIISRLVVVAAAADIGVEEDGHLLGRRGGFVGAVLEDGRDRFVGTGIEKEGTGAGGINAFLAIALDQPENADGRAKSLFRMWSRTEDDLDQRLGVGPHFSGFRTDALMGPVAVAAMRAWHMLGDRRRPMRHGAAQMRGDALAAEEYLDGLEGDPCLDLLMHEVVRNAVVMLGDLDMVVEIDPAALPLSVLIRFVRQGGQCGSVELLEQGARP